MKTNARTAMTALLLATMVISPLAEAKRLGGGSSYGMSRTHSSSSSSSHSSFNSGSSARPYQPAPNYNPQPTPARKGPGWGGVAAGVAAGAIAGSLLSHSGSANANNSGSNNGANNGTANAGQTQNADGSWSQPPVQQQVQQPVEKKSGFPWFWLILLGGIGYFVYRRFNAQKAASAGNPSGGNPLGFGNNNPQPTSGGNTNIFGQPVGGASAAPFGGPSPFTGNGNALPDGTEPAAFLRQARSTFLHMQTMNSSSSVEELRRYFTPEMFTSIQADIAGNTDTAEFPQLNAQIVDSTQENGQYVTSVLYSGTVSEDLNAAPVPFSETWHFVQPIGSTDRKWLVAGIQQG